MCVTAKIISRQYAVGENKRYTGPARRLMVEFGCRSPAIKNMENKMYIAMLVAENGWNTNSAIIPAYGNSHIPLRTRKAAVFTRNYV
jgi:hypothetical protein